MRVRRPRRPRPLWVSFLCLHAARCIAMPSHPPSCPRLRPLLLLLLLSAAGSCRQPKLLLCSLLLSKISVTGTVRALGSLPSFQLEIAHCSPLVSDVAHMRWQAGRIVSAFIVPSCPLCTVATQHLHACMPNSLLSPPAYCSFVCCHCMNNILRHQTFPFIDSHHSHSSLFIHSSPSRATSTLPIYRHRLTLYPLPSSHSPTLLHLEQPTTTSILLVIPSAFASFDISDFFCLFPLSFVLVLAPASRHY